MHHIEPIKITDSKVFENLICDYLSEKLRVKIITFGRSGQKQYGVDGLHYKPDENKDYNVVQCKNYNNTKLTYNDILDHLDEVIKSNIKVDNYYFVTASDKDVLLQENFQKNYLELVKKYGFNIELMYYSDIFHDIFISHQTIAKKYFSFIFEGCNNNYNEALLKKERDLNNLFNIARYTDSSFINILSYIDNLRTHLSTQYASFAEAISSIKDLCHDGNVFYDERLNFFFSVFKEYDDMIDNILLANYSFEPSQNGSYSIYYRYIGKEEQYNEVKEHLYWSVHNYHHTFKSFLNYIKLNYLAFDINAYYYCNPLNTN